MAGGDYWGSVADWVSATATVLAFGIATATYLWSVSISRQSRARQVSLTGTRYSHLSHAVQAKNNTQISRGVAVQRGGPTGILINGGAAMVTTTITNHSEEVMGPFRVDLARAGAGALVSGVGYGITALAPSESVELHLVFPDTWHPNHPRLLARVVFRDASGRWWQRVESEAVRRAPRRIRPGTSALDARRVQRRSPDDPHVNAEDDRVMKSMSPDVFWAD